MKKIYITMFFFSLFLMVLSVAAIFRFGLNLGSDFRGGSLMEVQFLSAPDLSKVREVLKASPEAKDYSLSPVGEKGLIIRLKEINESDHQRILSDLQTKLGKLEEKRFSSIGAVIGKELKSKSLTAIVIVLLAIIIYIAFVFRKLSRTLSSWAMGLAAILALAHDVVIPIGVFAVLGRYLGIEVTAIFVAAVLTILGYSVSDTVVVFDRVRENILRFNAQEGLAVVVHRSVMQTLVRSLNTTFTTLLSLLAIYFFGGETIRYFALALILGIFLGSYSSIFVAAPALVWWTRKRI